MLPQLKSTPLRLAALKGHVAVVKVLIEAGADIETKDHVSWLWGREGDR